MTKLTDAVATLQAGLSPAEKSNLRTLLTLAANGFTGGGKQIVADQAAFDTAAGLIVDLRDDRAAIREKAFCWRGRPKFLSEADLFELQVDSRAARHAATLDSMHFVAKATPRAFVIGSGADLVGLVSDSAGVVEPTGVVSFIYYDEAGQGIAPHIDAEQTSVNVIMMLDHYSESTRKSALILYLPGREPERVTLAPGEIVVFHAGAITHERERVSSGEKISLISFGFRPIGIN